MTLERGLVHYSGAASAGASQRARAAHTETLKVF
jgi:hypothetical protein